MAKRRLPSVGRGFSRAVTDVSSEELELFEREVADDRRLAPDARGRVEPPVRRSALEPLGFSPGVPSSPSPVEASPEELDSYVAPGVDRRELRKLRRGDYEPDMRIDLHGLMAKEAIARVTRVLDSGPVRRPRCLCVVHGRGLHSAGNVAVLRSRVRAFLAGHPAVLAFADAPRTDGSSGAVYVLLRRESK